METGRLLELLGALLDVDDGKFRVEVCEKMGFS